MIIQKVLIQELILIIKLFSNSITTPFINIGSIQLNPISINGWKISSLGTPQTSNYDLIAQEINNSGTLIGPQY